MVRDDDVDVVEDVEGVGLVVRPGDDAGVLGVVLLVHVAAHGEAGGAVLVAALHRVAPGDGHVVDDPVVLVVHAHALLQLGHLLLALGVGHVVVLGAHGLALAVVLVEEDLQKQKSQKRISNTLNDSKSRIKSYFVCRRPDSLSKHDLSEILRWRVRSVLLAKVKAENDHEIQVTFIVIFNSELHSVQAYCSYS